MEKQLLGTNAPLSKSPLNVEPDNKKAPATSELLGEHAPTKETPFNLMPLNANTRKGESQMLGSAAPLSQTPMHGWQSGGGAPDSKRTDKQSE